jgi:hypothetical protein
MMNVSYASARRRNRRAPVVLVLTIGFLAIISTFTSKSTRMSMCLAFNTMTPSISSTSNRKIATATKTTTRLYNGGSSYDDQYAQFYNTDNNNEVAEVAAVEDYDIPSDNTMMATTINGETEEHGTPPPPTAIASAGFGPGFGSYLESLNGSADINGVVVEQQQEQVYYEATNSYEAPPAQQLEVEEVHVVVEENKYPFTALASTPAVIEEEVVVEVRIPPSSFATPDQYNSSPTLSAQSPTISVTLPVGLRPPILGPAKDISYGENSRKFRRTVYTHEDWVRHRSPDRFFRYIASVPTSGIAKNLARELYFLTAITALVVFYNGLITGYQDINGLAHGPVWSSPFLPPLTLPMQPFALASPSLGLLLGKLFFLFLSIPIFVLVFITRWFCFVLFLFLLTLLSLTSPIFQQLC